MSFASCRVVGTTSVRFGPIGRMTRSFTGLIFASHRFPATASGAYPLVGFASATSSWGLPQSMRLLASRRRDAPVRRLHRRPFSVLMKPMPCRSDVLRLKPSSDRLPV